MPDAGCCGRARDVVTVASIDLTGGVAVAVASINLAGGNSATVASIVLGTGTP